MKFDKKEWTEISVYHDDYLSEEELSPLDDDYVREEYQDEPEV